MMALLPYLKRSELNESQRRSEEEFERIHGRPGWLRLLAANYPPLFDAIDAMYPRFMIEGKLERQTKELMFVASADVRSCLWCGGGHSRLLMRDYGLSQEEIIAARRGGDAAWITDEQRTLVAFARRVAEDPTQISEADMEELRELGLDDSAIMEAFSVCCLAAFTNTLSDGMKMADDLEDMGLAGEYF